jgi:hypothetical protein
MLRLTSLRSRARSTSLEARYRSDAIDLAECVGGELELLGVALLWLERRGGGCDEREA